MYAIKIIFCISLTICSYYSYNNPSLFNQFKARSIHNHRITNVLRIQTDPNAEVENEVEVTNDATHQEEADGGNIIDTLLNQNETLNLTAESAPIDPIAKATSDYEFKLQMQLSELENTLRSERLLLSKTRDKISESGKTGYFIVQAQVNDFLRKKEAEQKARVLKNKRDFVEKILPVVDQFRQAVATAPPTTEREQSMHTNFGSILPTIINVFEKYGYKEIIPGRGDKLDALKHQIMRLEPSDISDGLIIECIRTGLCSADETQVIRKAQVAVSQNSIPATNDNVDGPEVIDQLEGNLLQGEFDDKNESEDIYDEKNDMEASDDIGADQGDKSDEKKGANGWNPFADIMESIGNAFGGNNEQSGINDPSINNDNNHSKDHGTSTTSSNHDSDFSNTTYNYYSSRASCDQK